MTNENSKNHDVSPRNHRKFRIGGTPIPIAELNGFEVGQRVILRAPYCGSEAYVDAIVAEDGNGGYQFEEPPTSSSGGE